MASSSHSPGSSRTMTKSHRVLACVLCQQRKVKCDRHFPCSNCVRASAQCVPATMVPRKRRRKLPEAEAKLLDRIRHYERLLSNSNIAFEPFKADYLPHSINKYSGDTESKSDGPAPTEIGRTSGVVHEDGTRYEDFRSAVDRWFADTESDGESIMIDTNGDTTEYKHQLVTSYLNKTWRHHGKSHLTLFGFSQTNLDLASMHPNQVQMFRLWQIYLDNVNPILKVTHTPTLQLQIIEAASNLSQIDPALQALMFSIYCMAILSMTEQQCQSQLASNKTDLLTGYQMSCQQALLESEFLSTSSLHCLTAIYQYLISTQADTDPRATASVLGLAIRIANRIGIHSEAMNTRCPVVEAEIRRRLWWSLNSFDARICEVAGYKMKTHTFVEAGGCKLPLNVNDFDIRPEMQTPPEAHKTPTEALFTVVRSEIADFIYRLLFSPKDDLPSVEAAQIAIETGIERQLEEKYFRYCNPDNPLHLLTMWSSQMTLSKTRLILQYSVPIPIGSTGQESHRNFAFAEALKALEADTKLISSPLTKCFTWFFNMYFPFPAYVHLVQDLKERPIGEHAENAWQVMSENMMARTEVMQGEDNELIRVFVKRILSVWNIREAALSASPDTSSIEIPLIVAHFRQIMAQWSNKPSPSGITHVPTFDTGMYSTANTFAPEPFPDPFTQPSMDFSMGSMDWNTAYWIRMNATGWW